MRLSQWRGRLTATLSYSSMTQDDELLPPTIGSGVIGSSFTGLNLDPWNGIDALSTTSADAEIENLLVHTRLTLNPANKLRLSAEFRYRDEDNKTDYAALNPLTGEYGYIALDGGLGAIFTTRTGIFDPAQPGSRVRFRNIPFEKDEMLVNLEADYRISTKTKVTASYKRDETEHKFREFNNIDEDSFRLQLTHRGMNWGSVRLSYEYADRDGDTYNFNPYEPFYTSSLASFQPRFVEGNAPHTLSALRKYDIAGRNANVFDAKVNLIIGERTDLSFSGRYEDEDFNAEFGLRDTETVAANVEWNYHLAQNSSLFCVLFLSGTQTRCCKY